MVYFTVTALMTKSGLNFELAYLVQLSETLTVVGKPHPLRVFLVNGYLVVETQQVDEETTHLACTKN